jgi:MFS-type transporter involved in bile tolerance (Atg22 family)
MYGVNAYYLSFIGVLPTLVQMVQIFVPAIAYRIGNRKRALMIFSGISRFSFFLLPITIAAGIKNPVILFIITTSTYLFNSLASSFWVSMMKDAVSQETSGKYYGRRNLVSALFSMGLTYFYSFILDHIPGETGFFLITVIGAGFALADFVAYRFHSSQTIRVERRFLSFREVLKDKKFVKFLAFTGFWNLAIAFASPFYSYYQLVNLHLSYSYLSTVNIINGIVAMVFYILWGKVADKIGSGTVLTGTSVIVALLPLVWVLITPETLFLIVVIQVLSGIFWPAVNTTVFTTMIQLFPSERTETYFSAYSFVNGLGALIGSSIGGLVATLVSGLSTRFLGISFFGIQILFIGTCLLRLVAWLLLKKVRVSGPVTVSEYISTRLRAYKVRLVNTFIQKRGVLKKPVMTHK